MSNPRFLTPAPVPSKITIPPHAHPLGRLVFSLMRERAVSYDVLEHYSGVLRSTIKSWRGEKAPSLHSVEAVLGAFGWSLVPCPSLEELPPDVLDQLETVGLNFLSDHQALAAALTAAVTRPETRAAEDKPAPRLRYGAPYWAEATA